MTVATSIVEERRDATPDWDARAVSVPGGHVLQSKAWASYRADGPEEYRFLTFDDGTVAVATLRRSRGLPGCEAVVRKGPAHRDEGPERSAGRAIALAAWAREHAARDLYLDPELEAAHGYETALADAGFEVTEGREPSIHVLRRVLEPGLDEAALLASLSKSTRQRIRTAQAAGTVVEATSEPERMARFGVLLRERADVLGIALQASDDYLAGWRVLIDAGLARLLLADHGGEIVGGLFLYRQGGIHATAFSADDAARRRELPGTMHLVRWTALRDAAAEGCRAIELGGVDLPGQRRPPEVGDANRGLYEHKRGFGAEWVERAPPHRIVLRRGAEALARVRRRSIDVLRGMRR
jgi:hypothetical protein